MNNVMTIAGNELRRIFVSPLAWSVLGVVQLILGFVFLMLLIDYANNPQIAMDQYTGVADFIGAGLYGFAVIVLTGLLAHHVARRPDLARIGADD